MKTWMLASIAAVALTACGAQKDEPTGLQGSWRAVLTVPGGDLPFGLDIAREAGRDVAWLVNGPERVRIDALDVAAPRVAMRMPGYPHRIEAALVDGRLEGQVVFLRPGGETKAVRLVAMRDQPWRFFPAPSARQADFSGRWALIFHDPETGQGSAGIAELTQQGHVVTGTVLRESGDDRYIAGEARGDTVYLSRFDGGSAYLYVARLGADGTLAGEFRTGTGSFRTLSGRREPDARLADATTLAAVKADAALSFTFPGLDGRPVSLADERFRGKVVVVMIGGTWCPNCHDEATFMRDFLPARRAQGLEAVQLMFEYSPDFASAAASVQGFVDKFRIDYPVLIAGSYGPGEVQKALPQIEKFYAYPTMLVLGRDGRVRHTHTGFSGPATGVHYEQFRARFATLIDELLAET